MLIHTSRQRLIGSFAGSLQQRIFILISLLLPLLLAIACSTTDKDYLVYAGTYTGSGSDGIYAYRFDATKGDFKPLGLAAKTDHPSFLATDSGGKFLYAVNELDSFQQKASGAVSVFSIEKETGKLELLQQVPSLGAAPCHVSLDQSGRYLLTANYNGGNVAVFPIGGDGRLGPASAFIQYTGSGVNPDRQTGPHAHFIQVTNDNRFVMVADLGTDRVFVYRFDPVTGSLTAPDSCYVTMNPGSGPRHIAFAPSGKFVYVLNELTSTVTVFAFESETGWMKAKQTISALPENFSGENTAAEVAVDAKSQFLYVSNRGDDSIGVFSINSNDGSLTPVEWVSSGGKTPRHIEIDPTGRWLIASNQNSGNVVLFRIDQATGQLIQTSRSIDLASPVCIRLLSINE